jgi:hypothetical protein
MKKTILNTIIFSLVLISAPSFAKGNDEYKNALTACKSFNGVAFVKSVSSDKKVLKKFTPKSVFFGTLEANNETVYQVEYSPRDFSFPYSYAGKNVDNEDLWVDKTTLDDEYPTYAKVSIIQDDTNQLKVRWQVAEYEIGEKGKVGKLISTSGKIQQMEFSPNGKNNCWELASVYNVKE